MSKIEKEGIYLIYLRKSRADNPDESVEEVLAKHERLLQDYFEKEIGRRISEDCIYREIVSGGESLAERIEISKVLSRIEDKEVLGVACADPQRLSRGSLTDCDILIDRLRFTNTLVITPMMVYDLNNKMERRFFQDELMRGRDYLEYVKEALWRGRCQSALQGKYSSPVAPYGYNRIKIGKDWTLEPNENADVVRLIFQLYAEKDLSPLRIADRLTDMGIPSATNGKWSRSSITNILNNKHYDGKVAFCKYRTTIVFEHGEKKARDIKQSDDDVIVAEGKHQAIVDHSLFEKAQEKLNRRKEEFAPRNKRGTDVKNVFASILKCKNCGRTMRLYSYNGAEFYVCPTRSCTKRADRTTFDNVIMKSLLNVELPNLEAKIADGDGQSLSIQKAIVDRLEKQLAEFKMQEETQYELLETRKYTQELFDKRNAVLREKMDACIVQLTEAKKSLPDAVDYESKVVALKEAIKSFNDATTPTYIKNRLMKSIISKVEYSSSPRQRQGINDFSIEITLNL